MYAEIAVHTPMARRLELNAPAEGETIDSGSPLGMTFHYVVPRDLRVAVQPGSLVWVPFGKEQLHGIVLALTETAPQGVTARPVIDLVLPEPVCTTAQLDLARWLSAACLAPLLDCLLLMLPTGLVLKAEPVLMLTDKALRALASDVPAEDAGQLSFAAAGFDEALHPGGFVPQLPGLKAEQYTLITLLREEGQIPERTLARHPQDLSRRSVVDPLIEEGLVARRRRIVDTPVKAKTERKVALIVNQETIDRVLPTLGRRSRTGRCVAMAGGAGSGGSAQRPVRRGGVLHVAGAKSGAPRLG